MILVEAGERSDRSFEAKVLFCAQLAARGHDVIIDDATLPEGIDRNTTYEAAPYLRGLPGAPIRRVIVIGGEVMMDEALGRLRAIGLADAVPVHLIARFADRQARISAQSRLAYVLGREPEVIDLAPLRPAPLFPGAIAPTAAIAAPRAGGPSIGSPRLILILPDEMIEEPATLSVLAALDNLPDFQLALVLSGRAKELVRASKFASLRVFGLTEQSAAGTAAQGDIAILFGSGVPGERVAVMLNDMFAAGKVVIDCTTTGAMIKTSAPAIRGPLDLAAVPNYLRRTVLANLREIARQVRESPWISTQRLEVVEGLLGLAAPKEKAHGAPDGRTIFLPTNGVGLGHARRCTLIAAEMGTQPVAFAAFPSCVPLVQAAGYDCLPLVSKSPYHPSANANDLVNYMRLRRALRTGDRLVFDGGYVFTSICRTVIEKQLDAVWLRRGLWQAGQITAAARDRERLFRQVIIPTEAFDELNGDMGFGDHVRKVGPIVADPPAADRAALRARLAAALDRTFETLVVTMLGAGVAADRTAQMQMLSAFLERRKDCLHLVLIWPGATVPPALYGWRNTVVCQTRTAPDVAAAADLVVTAAGYNSFHEVLYHRLPAIFVPQMAAYMDDQERRAKAASERGLAAMVAATELLLLEREVTAFLDGGKAEAVRTALREVTLPGRGNRAAAELILEERR